MVKFIHSFILSWEIILNIWSNLYIYLNSSPPLPNFSPQIASENFGEKPPILAPKISAKSLQKSRPKASENFAQNSFPSP